MLDWDSSRPWYHGSPFRFDTLRSGSTVTQNRDLARIFSHKPSIVSITDEAEIRHNGQRPGFLYRLAGPIAGDDLVPHPNSSMPAGLEWLTARDLPLKTVTHTEARPDELLTDEDVARLRSSGPG